MTRICDVTLAFFGLGVVGPSSMRFESDCPLS